MIGPWIPFFLDPAGYLAQQASQSMGGEYVAQMEVLLTGPVVLGVWGAGDRLRLPRRPARLRSPPEALRQGGARINGTRLLLADSQSARPRFSLRFTARDLTSVAIFAVIMIVVTYVIGMLGILSPLVWLVVMPVSVLVNGIVFMLFLTRVKHAGMVTLFGVVIALFFLYDRQLDLQHDRHRQCSRRSPKSFSGLVATVRGGRRSGRTRSSP